MRVVSLNYCLDEQLQPYAEQGIITLYPSRQHGARFEAILEFGPDLVLANTFTAHYRLRALEQANLNVVVLDEPASVAQAVGVARTLHELVTDGHSKGNGLLNQSLADALLGGIEPASTGHAHTVPSSAPRVLYYLANQWSFGTDTLWHDVATHLGWQNLAAQQGRGLVSVSLEHLLLWQPDIVVVERAEQASPDLAHINLRHPSFQRYIASDDVKVIQLPRDLSGCMAQQLPQVLAVLGEAVP
ncbi:ABC transporter substrate-binding protein [Aliidiomarina indica]|uniref:ABC transporter substrate-binding protein n=1 Tax=Aliidiomarina indica TaxID=2749147 RepID=UPI0018905BBE|nr:ABC transporter substrate-binding protein [Aliidiomarina indica]